MHQGEIASFMKALAPVIGEFVVKAVEPLRAECKRLADEVAALKSVQEALPKAMDEATIVRLVEERVAKLPPAQPGKDADPALIGEAVAKAVAAIELPAPDMVFIERMIGEKVETAVGALPPAEPGKSVTVEDVRPVLEELVAALPPAEPGKSVTVDDVRPLLQEMVDALPPAEPGKSVTVDEVRPVLEEMVAALPPAEPGKSVTVDDVRPLLQEMVDALPPAEPGKSVTVEEVIPVLEQMVAALPSAAPGKSVTVEDLAPLVVGEVEKAVANVPVKDPVGLAGALIDRDGQLVITLSDGATKTLGRVVGKDGVDVDMTAVRACIKAEVEALPKPRDGADGLGFDDMDLVEADGDLMLRFARGEVVKDFLLPVTTDRGVWTERQFRKGAGVTWAGSFWIAQRDTSAKPDTPDSGWRLAVKRGRDGASAYDVARKAGFAGTAREWLDSLRPQPAKPVKVG